MIATGSSIRSIRPMSTNIDDANKINPFIKEIEELYLLPVIGAKLYKEYLEYSELKASFVATIEIPTFIENAEIEKIFNGCYYTDSNSNDKYHSGLIKALSYLSHSRIVLNNNITVTAFGVQQKLSQNSEHVYDSTIVRHSNESKQIGEEMLRNVVEYINFTLENTSEIKLVESKIRRKRFNAIG